MNLSVFAYSLLKKHKDIFIVVKDNVEINRLSLAFDFFGKLFKRGINIGTFFSYEIPPHSSIKPSGDIVAGRLKALYHLFNGSKNLVFITNLSAIIQPTMREEDFVDRTFEIKKGGTFEMGELAEHLIGSGYRRVDCIEDIGEFSRKGCVVDVFSPMYDKPIRIEFFDDEVESVRLFYLENYRTFKELDSSIILPAREYDYGEDEFGYVLLRERNYLDDFDLSRFDKFSLVDEVELSQVYRLINFYREEGLFNSKSRVEKLLNACDFSEDLFEYTRLFPDSYSLDEKLKIIKEASRFNRIVIACGSSVRLEHLSKFFKDRGLTFRDLDGDPLNLLPGIYLSDLALVDGLYDKKEGLAIVSFSDLFGKKGYYSAKSKTKRSVSVAFSIGEKVVHKKYGIAKFNGLKRLNIDGNEEDFFELEYEYGDKIYLPVYNAELLSEYSGCEPLSSLRDNRWQKSQEITKRTIKKILTELVNTYAKRQLIKREPYNVDLYELKEFEAMFEYDETKDQMKAIEDIKRDMSKDVPMDRLICGDVSFGKTEVAMRAIAICVFNFRQAVFMVPTTLLSLQHFKTLNERFSSFPVRIALLNRFTTKKEREAILEGLKDGKVDVLVATHSVYSDKIEFANLGLVVIDEEHRFGVKVKEHLKSRYPYVDVLYMSATPIPRTLNMSLSGIMDVSVIKTPPLERKPIETIVSKRKLQVIRDAILRELSREGRVYFVHNTIDDIEQIKQELDNLIPFARKEVVHAKLPKKKIKDVFERFNSGEIDILVSTSIIESGLDIKSVDTIIIDDADRFGLSDLYQLRGRVGRGDRVAYAYLLLYKGKLTESAAKRLQYISEFIERGSGFNLALKDMELRGYGNLLGKDQSGKIKSMGYAVYMSLIEEAIRELKNQPLEREVEIRHTFDAYIPDEFAKGNKKVEIYKRLSLASSIEEVDELKEELADRFGNLPQPASNLVLIVKLKILSKRVFVKKLSLSQRGVLIEFYVDANIDTDRLIGMVQKYKGRFLSETSVFFGLLGKNLKDIYEKLFEIFSNISKIPHP